MNRDTKKKLTALELVTKMRVEKGIRFDLMTENEAIGFLKEKNNYLRTASYRKNYKKNLKGKNEGKYIDLDFKYLVELSSLDRDLRALALDMCIDIEHAIKIRLLQHIDKNPFEDGYAIVQDFLQAQENQHVLGEIAGRTKSSNYTNDLIYKYFRIEEDAFGYRTVCGIDCPIWVLVELLTFTELLHLYGHYYDSDTYKQSLAYGSKPLKKLDERLILPVRSLRNACAHNNCLLCTLAPAKGTSPPLPLTQFVSLLSISQGIRQKKLRNRALMEITALVYVYRILATSREKQDMAKRLNAFIDRHIHQTEPYFQSNDLVLSSLQYLEKILPSLLTTSE